MAEYLVETHMHTSEVSPCGKVEAREGIKLYKDLGYNAVVITDHFFDRFFNSMGDLPWRDKIDRYLAGYRSAREAGESLGMRVLLGMEFCVPGTGDDILAYGFDEKFLYENENLHLLLPDGLTAVARKNGLLLIQAHPFRRYISRIYDDIIEGMEVYNGNPRHDSNNAKAAGYASGRGMIAISGSDFHQMQDAGCGGIYLPTLPRDSKEFAAVLRGVRTPRLVTGDKFETGSFLARIMRRIKKTG